MKKRILWYVPSPRAHSQLQSNIDLCCSSMKLISGNCPATLEIHIRLRLLGSCSAPSSGALKCASRYRYTATRYNLRIFHVCNFGLTWISIRGKIEKSWGLYAKFSQIYLERTTLKPKPRKKHQNTENCE